MKGLGDNIAKVKCPIEDIECEMFHRWLESYGIPHTHIPNESKSQTKAAIIRGRKLKSLGVSAGYWDYDVYIPVLDIDKEVCAYELVKIEMKRAKKSLSKVSDAQKAWGDIYERAGIAHAICYGAEEAEKTIADAYELINQQKMSKKGLDI